MRIGGSTGAQGTTTAGEFNAKREAKLGRVDIDNLARGGKVRAVPRAQQSVEGKHKPQGTWSYEKLAQLVATFLPAFL
jgi:hypothetical protein